MFSNTNYLPRTILVTTNDEKINFSWYDGKDKISKDVLILTPEDIQAENDVIFPKHITEGDILLLHPFEEKRYVQITRIGDLENSKFVRFTEIAQLLGAKEYNIIAGSKSTYKQTLSADGKLNVPTKVEASVNVKKEQQFKEEMGFELNDKFLGVYKADENDYHKALDLVRKYNFEDEESLISLIRTRDPQNKNVHFNRTVKCNITQELNEALDIALSLKACSCFGFDANVNNCLESRTEKTVEIRFIFPETEEF